MNTQRRYYSGFAIAGCGIGVCFLGGCAHRDSETTDSPQRSAAAQSAISLSPSHAATGTSMPKKSVPALAPVQVEANRDAIPAAWKAATVREVATKQKVFALTFDDGPHPIYTKQVLAVLHANQLRATFFMVGEMVKSYPAAARLVRDSGHVVGNHTWTHPDKPRDPRREVQRTDAIIQQTLGKTPALFRPPYGLMKNGLAQVAQADSQTVVLWSAAGADWSHKATAGSIASQIVHDATPGGIALLHDGGGNRSATVAALPRIIRELKAKGYRFVTVPELLSLGTPAATH